MTEFTKEELDEFRDLVEAGKKMSNETFGQMVFRISERAFGESKSTFDDFKVDPDFYNACEFARLLMEEMRERCAMECEGVANSLSEVNCGFALPEDGADECARAIRNLEV